MPKHNIWRAGLRSLFIVLVILLHVSVFCPDASGKQEKHVLIINSYNYGYSWTNNEVKGIESVIGNQGGIAIHTEYMDSKVANDDKYRTLLKEIYKYKYERIRFDVIIATDDDALDFVKEYHEELFPGVPAVFCGINNFNGSQTAGYDYFTGVNEEADFKSTIDIALKLNPKLKSFTVVNDRMTTGALLQKEFIDKTSGYSSSVNFTFLDNSTLKEVMDAVSHLNPENSAVFYLSFFKDKSGELYTPSEAIPQIASAANVPMYGAVDYMLGYGIVGGMLKNSFYQGEKAARLALRVLNGEKPGDIPVVMKSPNEFMFDYNALQRFKIDIHALPPGATVINKPETFYYKYKHIIWGVAAVMTGLVIFIVILLFNIIQRIKAQNELIKYQNHLEELVSARTNELNTTNQQLQEDIAKRKQVEESLRQSQSQLVEAEKMAALGGLVAGVAHEINTPIGIAVTTASHLQDVTSKLSAAINNKTAKKDELFTYFTHATKSSELILTNLERTSELVKSFKMVSADQTSHEMRVFKVRDYIEKVITSLSPKLKQTACEVRLECAADLEINSYPGAIAQIITNFVINSLMHAFGDKDRGIITIEIAKTGDSLLIKYSDNGKGIPEENLGKIFNPFFTTNRAGGGTGLGLHILYNLITQTFKGNIKCESVVGEGTTFSVTIPVT
ncbi:sensor histidine kinase [Candidatus Magnetominusculus xianensis]|uniref:sensor histidine kinase n=1 Tax=Candidatus Magnetominusculus xianensis TaxID=1748249 RepID=UPI0019E8B7A9|nr:sensor histidine kinase [Candidatus Magnetominusculus xianensis]MBF0404758.1 sensor histidine kinase [Nitrospirota bacterium]